MKIVYEISSKLPDKIELKPDTLLLLLTQVFCDGVEHGTGGKLLTPGIQIVHDSLKDQVDMDFINRAIVNIGNEIA